MWGCIGVDGGKICCRGGSSHCCRHDLIKIRLRDIFFCLFVIFQLQKVLVLVVVVVIMNIVVVACCGCGEILAV